MGILKSVSQGERWILGLSLTMMLLLLIFRAEIPKALAAGMCVITYCAVAYDVVFEAFKTLFKRHRMSEQFLMTVATFGAFGLGDYPEALAVMIVTSCVIPAVVLLSFVWLANTILGMNVTLPKSMPHIVPHRSKV